MPHTRHDEPRQNPPREAHLTRLYRPVTAPVEGHEVARALAAIDAVTGAGEPGDDLMRFTGRRILRAAAAANAGRVSACPELQSAVSAWVASGAFERLYGLTQQDVAALIGAN